MKYIFAMLLALAVSTSFQACGDDDYEYTAAEVPDNAQVYFPSTNSSSIELTTDESSFGVTVMRIKTDEALTVEITATCESSNYTIPSSVTFGEGEDTATLTICYDADAMEYDDYVEITLTIADESLTTPYGLSEYTFTVGIPSPWVEIATGDYTYSLFFDGVDEDLTLYQNEVDPTRYKIEHWGYDVDFTFTYDEETGEVVVDDQEIGYEYGSYGMVYVDERADYFGTTEAGTSYYENGTFYFCVVYYVSAGYFDYGYETFTITSETSSLASTTKALSVSQSVKKPQADLKLSHSLK